MAIDGVGVLAMDSGAGGMSDEAGRLVFSRDPSGTFIEVWSSELQEAVRTPISKCCVRCPTSLYAHMLVPLSWVRWSA